MNNDKLFVCYPTKKNIENFNIPKYEFTIGATFKNEGHILDEWVRHYKYHGIDHIYLINDNSTDNYQTILEPYIKMGYVTLYNHTTKVPEPRQQYTYELYLRPVFKDTKWMAIIDLDEFIYSPINIDLKQVLRKHDDCSAIFLNWIMFGSSGHIEQPKYVTQSFTKRMKAKEASGKTLFKTAFLKKKLIEVHFVEVDGKTITTDDILINHYNIQSWSFFERVKMSRGDVATDVNVRDKNYFIKCDHKEMDDNKLALQNMLLFK